MISLFHGHPRLTFSPSWLVIIPAGGWTISTLYIPLFSEDVSVAQNGAVTATILLLMLFSVLAHVLAHLHVGRLNNSTLANDLPVFIYGDAAQSWLPSGSGWGEAAAACAGPAVNLLLSGAAYALWNAQISNLLNLVALFLSLFNLWLFVINLLPAFPMDGGRILRAALGKAAEPGELLTPTIWRAGLGACVALLGWGIFLYLQHSRFSIETAGFTLVLILLLLDGLRLKPVSEVPMPAPAATPGLRPGRLALALLLALLMFTGFSSSLLTNDGLDAPGVALSVEPMVRVPSSYEHPHAGTFLLTTVFSHAPILIGEWLVAHIDHAMTILPPEQVVPKNTTPQEQARQGYQQLDESEATAIAVGLRLAGFESQMTGKGAKVMQIQPDSHANGVLQPQDVITGLNGQPVRTADDLIRLVRAQEPETPVELEVRRGQSSRSLTVALLPPDSTSSFPRIGISIQTAGFDFKPPFPVSIQTQKINGGPSAGLMFTLTIYNALSGQDLTAGRTIAGTGTISLDGSVGPIGGVKQKVAAASAAGARYFLCPVENYADAVSVARNIQVVRVANVQEAVEFLKELGRESTNRLAQIPSEQKRIVVLFDH